LENLEAFFFIEQNPEVSFLSKPICVL
jgi:hypothetical protein